MTVGGIILAVLGAGLLIIAGLFFFAAVGPRQGFDIVGPGLYMTGAVVFAVLGAGGLLFGIRMVRENRDLREFDEAMEKNNKDRE